MEGISRLVFASYTVRMTLNEAGLIQAVEAAQAGDEHAFEALFRAHQNGVYALAMYFLRDPEVAADLTQDAFVRAWEQLPKLRDASAFEGWLKTMTKNLVRDHYRSRDEEDPLEESDLLPSEDDGPEESVETLERDVNVREAILS